LGFIGCRTTRRARIRNSDAKLDMPRRPSNPLFLFDFHGARTFLRRGLCGLPESGRFAVRLAAQMVNSIDMDTSAFKRLAWMRTRTCH
jgi:hypothetical protein